MSDGDFFPPPDDAARRRAEKRRLALMLLALLVIALVLVQLFLDHVPRPDHQPRVSDILRAACVPAPG